MFPRYNLFHHNFWNNEDKNMYFTSICIVFNTIIFLEINSLNLIFYVNQQNIKT